MCIIFLSYSWRNYIYKRWREGIEDSMNVEYIAFSANIETEKEKKTIESHIKLYKCYFFRSISSVGERARARLPALRAPSLVRKSQRRWGDRRYITFFFLSSTFSVAFYGKEREEEEKKRKRREYDSQCVPPPIPPATNRQRERERWYYYILYYTLPACTFSSVLVETAFRADVDGKFSCAASHLDPCCSSHLRTSVAGLN